MTGGGGANRVPDKAMDELEKLVRSLDKKYPLVPHTGAGRLFSTVRRMKAEKELGIPIAYRTGFAISVEKRKPANQLEEPEWEEFYAALCGQLKRDYPELYKQVFPDA